MDQPKNRQYVDKIRNALADVPFPATKEQIIQKKGDARLEVAQGKMVSVKDALKPINTDRFQNANQLLNEISHAHNLGWPDM